MFAVSCSFDDCNTTDWPPGARRSSFREGLFASESGLVRYQISPQFGEQMTEKTVALSDPSSSSTSSHVWQTSTMATRKFPDSSSSCSLVPQRGAVIDRVRCVVVAPQKKLIFDALVFGSASQPPVVQCKFMQPEKKNILLGHIPGKHGIQYNYESP